MYSDIVIPRWITYRHYNAGNEVKCYISNEYTHSYYEFEGITAELLSIIFNSNNSSELTEFIKKNELEDEIDDFISEISSLRIIHKKSDNISDKIMYNSAKQYTAQDHDVTMSFEDNMYSWLSSHGYMSRLFIEMTYNCNLSCIHCYNTKTDKRIIQFDEIKNAIDEAYDLGIFNVTLSGGECTLGKDFIKIAKYVRKKKLALDIFTNGQKLYDDENLFEELVKIYPYRVSLSLYSMNPEIHDAITGVKGSQKKTLAIINKLKSRNILVEIKCFLMEKNAFEYKAIQDYANEIGVSMTLACLFFNNPERNNGDVQVTDEQLLKIYSDKDCLLYAKPIHDIDNKEFFRRSVCSAGRKGLGIAPNLDIYVCSSLKILLGNLKTHSIKQIWKDSNIKSQLNCIKQKTKKDISGCFKQEYCKYCTYCPGIAMFAGKYMKKDEDFCRHAKIKLKAIEMQKVIK